MKRMLASTTAKGSIVLALVLATAAPVGCSSSAPTDDSVGANGSGLTNASYRDEVLADAPVHYWRLGESSGTTAVDVRGTGNAIYAGGVALGQSGALPGNPDTAAKLDGADDRVLVPSAAIASGPFSLEAWIDLAGRGSKGATDDATIMGFDYTHRILVQAWTYPSPARLLAQFDGNFFSSATVTFGAWHHVVYTFDGGAEHFYVDGAAAGSHATTKPSWNAPFKLGSYDDANYMFNGKLDEVAVYRSALSPARVLAHYTTGKTPPSTGGATACDAGQFHAEYFDDTTAHLAGSPALVRCEASIDHDWGTGSPGAGVAADHFSARWTGTLSFPSTGVYTIRTTGDDGVRLYLDGTLLLDKWIVQPPTTYTVTPSVTAGNHVVVLEYYENLGGAVAKVAIAAPSSSTPPPPPPPTPTSDVRPFGVIRLGNTLSQGTGYDRYGIVVCNASEAAACAALPSATKRLVYMDGTDLPTWFAGVDRQEAISNGWTLALEGDGSTYLLDVGNKNYQAAVIREVDAYLRKFPGIDGIYFDDVVASIQGYYGTPVPAKYSDPTSWWPAMQDFVLTVGGALKAKGWYVGANAIAFFPGNVGVFPGTDSNNGSATAEWWRKIGPGLGFLMAENWMLANGHLRSTANAWDNAWKGWQSLVEVAQDVGCDFVATVNVGAGHEAEIVYAEASMLIDWNGKGGGALGFGSGELYSTSWTRTPGAALGAKQAVGVGYKRQFANLTVYVNPSPSSSQDFGGGVVLGPTSALLK